MNFDMKSFVTEGACRVSAHNCGIKISFDGKGTVRFSEFSTLKDSISVKLSYEASGEATLSLFGITEKGEVLYRRDKLDGSELEYTFDPINLAVYRDMHSFVPVIAAEGIVELTVTAFDITEGDSKRIGSAAENISDEKHDAPKKMLFIGNSLVFGMEYNYGMCASAKDKDYFHFVSEYVKTKNPDCVFEKLYGSPYEACESLEAFERVYFSDANAYTHRPFGDSFTPDIDLITIQLGDNVNTPEKNATFAVSRDLLIERIRAACPRARLIWIHGWYNREPTYSNIVDLCRRHGIERIEIADLRNHDTEAHDQPTFINKLGEETPIKDTWRTHPGNRGMKAIAERIIERLNLR
jgi:hypothetical protein